jgi:hypothetical protein
MRATRRSHINKTQGAWADISSLPAWPMGLVAMQLHVGDGDYEDVAALIRLRAKIAKLIFETE